jgi:hypothetical protein
MEGFLARLRRVMGEKEMEKERSRVRMRKRRGEIKAEEKADWNGARKKVSSLCSQDVRPI